MALPALCCERHAFRGRRHDLVREPGAGNRHAGFDERGEETWLRWRLRHPAYAKAAGKRYSPHLRQGAPHLDSTAYTHSRDDAAMASTHRPALGGMNVFELRDQLVDDYRDYTRSFIKIRDPRTKEFVDSHLGAEGLAGAAAAAVRARLRLRRSTAPLGRGAPVPDPLRTRCRLLPPVPAGGPTWRLTPCTASRAMQNATATSESYDTVLDPPPADPICCHPPSYTG